MVERQLPKLHTRVRFPSPAPNPPYSALRRAFSKTKNHLEDEKFLSMVMGKLRAIAHFDGI